VCVCVCVCVCVGVWVGVCVDGWMDGSMDRWTESSWSGGLIERICKLIIVPGYWFNKPLTCNIRGCIQKFPDWPPGARIAIGTAPCH
jgi:hypothetical protein